ncbi:MAG TPA: hypothetical protein VM050_04950 [Patescibacteria group bacterium]|nr:hypothetical protein [Patescibacteria group bacterium]
MGSIQGALEMKYKNILIITLLLSTLSLVVVSVYYTTNMKKTTTPEEDVVDIDDPSNRIKGPAPFELKSTFALITTVSDQWNKSGMSLHLPTKLSGKLIPMGVWISCTDDNKYGDYGIFIYSAKNRTKIATAELVIEVRPGSVLPFNKESALGIFTTINGCDAYIQENALVGHVEYRKLYGNNSTILCIIIDNLCYWMRGMPQLSVKDMVNIASNMSLLK